MEIWKKGNMEKEKFGEYGKMKIWKMEIWKVEILKNINLE